MKEGPNQPVPPWENDPFSSLLADAAFNERASSLNSPEVFSLLKQIHSTFECVRAAIQKDDRDELLLPRILLVRIQSAFLAAVRLAMSGQTVEAAPVVRAAIEQAWYALHIARDPRPPERGSIWLKRDSTPKARARCKQEFRISNVFGTHKALDATSARTLKQLYEDVIDFGGHPNKKGVLASMQREEMLDTVTYKIGILNPDPLLVSMTLKTVIEVAIGTLKVSQLIAPRQLKVAGLDLTIEQLIREVPRTFADKSNTLVVQRAEAAREPRE